MNFESQNPTEWDRIWDAVGRQHGGWVNIAHSLGRDATFYDPHTKTSFGVSPQLARVLIEQLKREVNA